MDPPGSPLLLVAHSPQTRNRPRSPPGDFNDDGIVDLIVTNGGGNAVSVFLGNGSGGFTPAPCSPLATGSSPGPVAVGDFNGDRQLDIAVLNTGDNTLTLLLGNGGGGFSRQASGVLAVSPYAITIAAGVFNGDGTQDVVVACLTGLGAVNMAWCATCQLSGTPNNGANTGLGSIWQGGRAMAVDGSGNIYLTTGNGSNDNEASGITSTTNYGNSVVKLSPSLTVMDFLCLLTMTR